MRFGSVPSGEVEGAILAHSVALPDGRLPKGTWLGPGEIAALAGAGIDAVVVARLEDGDIAEDSAAALIAAAMSPSGMTLSSAVTGRLNLHAAVDGLFVADRARIDRFNRIDPAITLACLTDHVTVRAGDMVATIKIIPLGVAGDLAARAAAILAGLPALEVKPFLPRAVGLIATRLPSLKAQVMDKTRRVLHERLQRSGSRLLGEVRVDHAVPAVAEAIRESARHHGLVVIFGASAVTDRDDVIPAAIRAAGGEVLHIGMPVDPGNLLVLGAVNGIPVIGAPGCARSPKENGLDWVLDRILAGETVGPDEITGMGVGGLLAEIPTRPRPRAIAAPASKPLSVRTVVLAAGRARRMGDAGPHKLLAEFDGVPLVRRTVETAMSAGDGPVTVVTGHRAAEIRAALDGLHPAFAHNDDFASGMASSLITGLDAAGLTADGILVMLADMPGVSGADLRRLLAAFEAGGGETVVRAVCDGKRGNPVILPRALFGAVRRLEGDVGARHVIETGGVPVVEIDIGPAAHLDLDTPEAILAAGGVLKG